MLGALEVDLVPAAAAARVVETAVLDGRVKVDGRGSTEDGGKVDRRGGWMMEVELVEGVMAVSVASGGDGDGGSGGDGGGGADVSGEWQMLVGEGGWRR